MGGIEGVDGTLMLEKGHYEIEYHRGGSQTITNLVYDARRLPSVINGIINTGGTICLVRTVEDKTKDPAPRIEDTCCGKCPGAAPDSGTEGLKTWVIT